MWKHAYIFSKISSYTSGATRSAFAFRRWCLTVIRHLTAVFDCESWSFEFSANSEDLSSRGSLIYFNDLPFTKFPSTLFGFVRSKEPLCTRNGDTIYFRFQPGIKLSWFFPEDTFRSCFKKSFSVCVLVFLLFQNPKRELSDMRRADSPRVERLFCVAKEDVDLEETLVLVLDSTLEMFSTNDCLLSEKFNESLDRLWDFFRSGFKPLNLFRTKHK